MRRQDIRETVYRYIAEQMNCSMQDLHTGETVFIEDATKPEKYIKILSVGDTDIITLSSDMFSDGKRHLDGKAGMSYMKVIMCLVRHFIMSRI